MLNASTVEFVNGPGANGLRRFESRTEAPDFGWALMLLLKRLPLPMMKLLGFCMAPMPF